MKAKRRKILQLVLAIAILGALVRVGVIFYERHETKRLAPRQQETALNPDYYVVPKRMHAYDLASARELTKQPVWVKEGYRYSYYRYDSSRRRADLKKTAGTLGPIERIDLTAVETQPTPGDPTVKQLLGIFSKDGKEWAIPVGAEQSGTYQINIDEMFFIEDPHQLYKHWPGDVWRAIQNHQVKPGMNEIQASFALGVGIPEPGQGEEKTVNYPNGGDPIKVLYRDGRAVEIKTGEPSQT